MYAKNKLTYSLKIPNNCIVFKLVQFGAVQITMLKRKKSKIRHINYQTIIITSGNFGIVDSEKSYQT